VPPESLPLPAAVLWDMDGTLIDTEPFWIDTECKLMAEHGVSWTSADGLTLVGLPLLESARILQTAGLDLPAPTIVDALVGRMRERLAQHMPWRDGVPTLLRHLADARVPCAIVSMSYRSLVTLVADAAPPGTFSSLVAGDEVTNGKPHPEPYLLAARKLGVDIRDCVAIEDSPPGVGSALAAGAATLAVQTHVPIPPAPGLSRVASLTDVDLALLARLHGGEVIDFIPQDDPRRTVGRHRRNPPKFGT